MEITEKIVEILENNNVKPVLSGDPEFLGIIRIYEDKINIDKILSELESLFKDYSSYSINSSHTIINYKIKASHI